MNCLIVDLAGGKHLARLPDDGAGAGELALEMAVEHRPAREHDRRECRPWPPPISMAGVVLSQPVVSTTPSSG